MVFFDIRFDIYGTVTFLRKSSFSKKTYWFIEAIFKPTHVVGKIFSKNCSALTYPKFCWKTHHFWIKSLQKCEKLILLKKARFRVFYPFLRQTFWNLQEYAIWAWKLPFFPKKIVDFWALFLGRDFDKKNKLEGPFNLSSTIKYLL